MLETGKPFVNFNLQNQDGKQMKLADFAGKWLVVYVYPKDDTPGCTIQGKSFTASKADFGDLALRLDCQVGAWLAMAGAVTGRGLGASHAIGHTLGGSYGAPHGLTSCVALPAVLKWNAEADAERQALVSALMGQPGRPAGEVVEALCHALGLPTDLKSLGVRPGDFHAIAEHTLGDRGVKANPRPIRTAEDIVEILELA